MQGCHPSSIAGTWGTTGVQGCHPSSTARTWGTARIQSYLPSITAGIQGTARTAGISPIHHCRDTRHCHGRDRAALPSLHCQHSSTASLALRDTKAPPIWHCRDAGAPCITRPALRAGHCHPSAPLAERGALPTPVLEGHRLTAHPALQSRHTPQGRSRSSGTAQPQHTAMVGTASPLCCTVTRQPHTLHQQILFPLLTADTLFLPIPSHSRLGHCTHVLGAHPAPQGQPRTAHPVPMSTPPAAETVTEVLPACIAETHTAHAAPQAPSHWKPPPSMHTLQRQCQVHCQPHRDCPLLRRATCPVTKLLPSAVPGHQLSRPLLSILGTHLPPGSRHTHTASAEP